MKSKLALLLIFAAAVSWFGGCSKQAPQETPAVNAPDSEQLPELEQNAIFKFNAPEIPKPDFSHEEAKNELQEVPQDPAVPLNTLD